jgi:hypothetical protein
MALRRWRRNVDIAALLLACSVHADDALLLSIAYVQGKGSPYAVTDVSLQHLEQDDALGIELTPSSAKASREAVARILAISGEPVLGLLPVRPEWANELGKSLDDMFDACSNIAIASAKLSELDYGCRAKGLRFDAPARRACTLDHYGTSLGLPALRQAVLADLLLPSPFPSNDDVGAPAVVIAVPHASGLFFAAAPVPSTQSISPNLDASTFEVSP